MKLLEEGLFPDCRRLYPHEDYVLQQAASHTSKVTQSFLEETTPDCNPMDYTSWDSLSEKVHSARMEVFTENEQKDNIREKWEEIRKSISS
jgi:hypothetical protein